MFAKEIFRALKTDKAGLEYGLAHLDCFDSCIHKMEELHRKLLSHSEVVSSERNRCAKVIFGDPVFDISHVLDKVL